MSIQYNDLNFKNDYDSSLLLCCDENIMNFLNTLPIIENINKLEFYQNNNLTLDFYFINKTFLDNRLNPLTLKYYNDDIDAVLFNKYNEFLKYIDNVFKIIDKDECQICFKKIIYTNFITVIIVYVFSVLKIMIHMNAHFVEIN